MSFHDSETVLYFSFLHIQVFAYRVFIYEGFPVISVQDVQVLGVSIRVKAVEIALSFHEPKTLSCQDGIQKVGEHYGCSLGLDLT